MAKKTTVEELNKQLEKQVLNHSIYVWGASGNVVNLSAEFVLISTNANTITSIKFLFSIDNGSLQMTYKDYTLTPAT